MKRIVRDIKIVADERGLRQVEGNKTGDTFEGSLLPCSTCKAQPDEQR